MNKRSLWVVLTLLMLAFALLGCAAAAKESMYEMPQSSPMEAGGMDIAAEEMARDEYAYTESESSTAEYDSGITETGERIVLKDANLAIKVDDPAAVINAIAQMAERMGGFVVSSNIYQTYYYNADRELPQGYITVRVPAESLNAALNEIKGMTEDPAYDVTSESISGQDVTSQYTDLQSRLRNLEDAQEQMRVFMDEAKDTEDVLAVYRELKSISEEIEIIKGQLQYYEEASALSAIYIEVQPKYEVATVDIGGWEPKGVAKKAIQSLVNAFQFLVEAMIWVILFVLPVLLMIALPLVLLILVLRALITKKKRAKNAKEKLEDSPDKGA
ncbi:MAG: DUF4349 domain-containing protein [Anaerolineae bacterium]|nr:DUF4349 domain-containing protein [Anaerolineae bacterium]